MSKQRLVSGIQPSGNLHLGNYLGAVKQFVELQKGGDYDCFFFIADYHSMTQEFEPEEKRREVLDLTASYIAAGLDPEKSTLFLQSMVSEHANLAWILSTLGSFGRLQRMTQFKEKSESQQQNVNVGLFYYPILMAADILLYDGEKVPVGEDQIQHLELTRDLARRFNNKFGEIFVEPEPIMTDAPRVKDLQSPEDKMSKSSPKGCLFIDDGPETIEDKIMSAVTDSENDIRFDMEEKPGVSNLILIYSSLTDLSKGEVEDEFEGIGYGDFKNELASIVEEYFADYRDKKDNLINDESELIQILNEGSKEARKSAEEKMKNIREKIGIDF